MVWGWGFGTRRMGVGHGGVAMGVGGDLWRGPVRRHGAKRKRALHDAVWDPEHGAGGCPGARGRWDRRALGH
jgi:hypothetical protein